MYIESPVILLPFVIFGPISIPLKFPVPIAPIVGNIPIPIYPALPSKFAKWILENVKLLEKACLWVENPEKTIGWVHLQIFPPGSGRRFFDP